MTQPAKLGGPGLSVDFDRLCSSSSADDEFKLCAGAWNGVVELTIGELSEKLVVSDRHLHREAGTRPANLDVVRVRGRVDDWEKLLARVPPVGWHDILWAQGLTIDCDLFVLARCSRMLRRLVELMREQLHGISNQMEIPDPSRRWDAMVGRYLYTNVAGTQYRIYLEEAGVGVPLLLQHTAGADSRQWRHLLEDEDVRQHFHMIAYDLPFHGRSLPPTSKRWWASEYRLTRQFLMECVLSISEALELERPVFMGCSVGGMLAVDLAYRHPEAFRAIIGVNAALGLPSVSDRERRLFESWADTRASGDWRASCMLGRTSPTSPEPFRRETAWIYSQGAPAVHTGDLGYYRYDYDLTEEQASQIDTRKVGVYLLSGEYDKLTANGSCERLARCIRGSSYEVIPGVGHFGPMEDPVRFKEPLRRVLDKISSTSRAPAQS